MPLDHDAAFAALRALFADLLPQLDVTKDTATEYMLSTRVASPLPQHEGAPMFFGGARKGKAYASLHFFPLYMCDDVKAAVPAALASRMQGKTCFNFKAPPDPAQTKALRALVKLGLRAFARRGWA